MNNDHNERVINEEHWLTVPNDADPLCSREMVVDGEECAVCGLRPMQMTSEELIVHGYEPGIEGRRLAAQAKISEALQLLFPEETWDDSVDETARRVSKVWAEYIPKAEIDFTFTTFKAAKSQMVFVGNISFSSLCAHHLMPFNGKAHIAYLPGKTQVGLSKIPRLVQFWAGRPQVQENLTAMLLSDLKRRLDTSNVMVVLEAAHSCVSARGARLHDGVMRTALPSGMFLSSDACRQEFYALLARG